MSKVFIWGYCTYCLHLIDWHNDLLFDVKKVTTQYDVTYFVDFECYHVQPLLQLLPVYWQKTLSLWFDVVDARYQILMQILFICLLLLSPAYYFCFCIVKCFEIWPQWISWCWWYPCDNADNTVGKFHVSLTGGPVTNISEQCLLLLLSCSWFRVHTSACLLFLFLHS